jgi:hypothetical protein
MYYLRQARERSARGSRSRYFTPEDLREAVRRSQQLPTPTLDIAAVRESAFCPAYLGPDHTDPARRDALSPEVDWAEEAGPDGCCWANPPHEPRELERFLQKVVETSARCDVVGIIPADPTTKRWIRWVKNAGARWEPIPGRVRFTGPHSQDGQDAPMGVAIVHWPKQGSGLPGGETELLPRDYIDARLAEVSA